MRCVQSPARSWGLPRARAPPRRGWWRRGARLGGHQRYSCPRLAGVPVDTFLMNQRVLGWACSSRGERNSPQWSQDADDVCSPKAEGNKRAIARRGTIRKEERATKSGARAHLSERDALQALLAGRARGQMNLSAAARRRLRRCATALAPAGVRCPGGGRIAGDPDPSRHTNKYKERTERRYPLCHAP